MIVAREKIVGTKMAAGMAICAGAFAIASPILALATGIVALALPPLVPAVLLGGMAVIIPVLRVVVTSEHLMIQVATTGPKIPISAIQKVRVGGVPRAARTFGAKLVRGRWIYSAALGVPDGVVVRYEEKGKTKEIFFASRDPKGMVEAIESARTGTRVRVEHEEHEVLEEIEAEAEATSELME